MIKIGNKQVNKMMINNKEVLKVVANGDIKYQKSVGPTLGRYVLQGAITGGSSYFNIIDTVTETQIWSGNVSTNIASLGSGKYKINYDCIQQAIQNILNQLGVSIFDLKVTNLYLAPQFNVKMSSTTLRYLKAISYKNNTAGNTIFQTTAKGTSAFGSSNVTIAWNDTNIISNYWDTTWTGGIEDISCRDGYVPNVSYDHWTQLECYTTNAYTTTSTNLQGVNNIGILVFFE